MKKIINSILVVLFITSNVFAQGFSTQGNSKVKEPVTWKTYAEKISDTEYYLVFNATIEDKWHLYSQYNPDGASLPMTFNYVEEKDSLKFSINGKALESKTKTKYNETWKKDEIFFEKNGTFKQKITLTDSATKKVSLFASGQACKTSCVFAEGEFEFDLTKAKEPSDFETNGLEKPTKKTKLKEPVTWKTHVEKINDKEYYLVFNATIEDKWHLYSQYNPDGASLPMSFNYVEEKDSLNFSIDGKALESKTKTKYNETWKKDEIFFDKKATFKQKITLKNPAIKKVQLSLFGQACITSCILVQGEHTFDLTKAQKVTKLDSGKKKKEKQKGLWTIFILSFLGGFAALLTPCVFPMIPMTVSFFTKQSKSKAQGIRNAIIYGLSIIGIYVLLGTVITAVFGADSLNILAANPWFNLFFFVLLVIFAISFLGAFEIMLPNSWANKLDRQADRGGVIGIVFMALALAVVSFSCTGPIVGTTLVEAASKGGIAPVISMLGFSSALAIPFVFFAAFPGYLHSLPRSGGWLNTVKVFLGFLELALAFKFLSNADLVWDLHLLEREVFIAIWIAIFTTMAFYLFGKIKLPHDSELSHISVGRLLMGIVTLTFVIYLIPGLWGAPLKAISGFPPPMKYSESPYGVGFTKKSFVGTSNGKITKIPKGAHLGPHDIIAFDDYDKGLAYAKKVNKPLFLDFTGKACVNCRKMEEKVWSDPSILQKLKNDVILVSLYVDVTKPLPKEEQYISPETGKKIKTYGNKWSDLQITRYKANAQPYYVMLDNDEKTLNGFAAYDPDPAVFENWLEKGIQLYK